ncbi:MAG: isoprenylcysteine carboxylmethyltransferase family protein [Burkholderiales bacterium]|nr:isoprenylcysteine carboxylmethyltransferase family protein [Burkholderiales bacterium]
MKFLQRGAMFAYGVFAYLVFLGTALYAIGFIGGFLVPTTLDGSPRLPLWQALAIDTLLLGLFAVQHSVMARPAFKRWWTRVVPEPVERSTYVLFSSVALLLLFAFWQPMGGVVWDVQGMDGRVALYALYAFGWALVFATTFLINHFDLFGLRQVWLHLRGQPYTHLRFVTPGPYRLVRHPLYVGWLFAFWATPTMTVAHLVFALATTAYILIAIQFEERDLIAAHGEDYRLYRARVPMLVPRLFARTRGRASV